MLILEDNFTTKLDYNTYAALGSFDGLHLGHLKLIHKAIELSKNNNCKSMIYTFKNHPLSTINSNLTPKLLMNNDTKLELLCDLGIDVINLAKFDTNFMKISPEDFIVKLIKCYNTRGIITGFNYRFGYKNTGDIHLLNDLSKKLGFELYVIEPVRYNNYVVSSSRIRNLISNGDVETANKMLLKPYKINGNVIEGKKLGRTIGFPTINLKFDKSFIIPQRGVYYTTVKYNNEYFKGITNVGINPTVQDNKLSVETYILDFDKNIYGEVVDIFFINRMREEVKFSSIADLSKQLEKDKMYAESQILHIY